MKYINKKQAPYEFSDFVRKNSPKQWKELAVHNHEIYVEACEALLAEQQNLCGYTEIFFRRNLKGHIDHFVKRDIDNRKTFDWNNLVYASLDDAFGARYKDRKIKSEDYNDIFNPVFDNPQEYFEYSLLGDIMPKTGIDSINRKRAEKTIELFNLNDSTLCNRRKDTIIAINSFMSGGMAIKDILDCLGETGFDSLKNQILNEL